VLAVVEAPFRGTLERGYADSFYLTRILGLQMGAVDVLLRGEAVLLARAASPDTHDRWDPGLSTLLDDGSQVLVDAADSRRFGLGPDALVPGVVPVDDGGVARWARYDAIWFL
jgi:hypothetical protein